MLRIFWAPEPEDVYKALVGDLAQNMLLTGMMGAATATAGLFAWLKCGDAIILNITLVAVAANAMKMALIGWHKLHARAISASLARSRHFETAHMTITALVAASVGSLTTAISFCNDAPLDVLATALVFGYCAGIASRLAIRPYIATAAILIASFPPMTNMLYDGEDDHRFIAAVCLIFIIGGLYSVAHAYRNIRRWVTMQFQMAALARHDPLTGLANRLGLGELFAALGRKDGEFIVAHAFDLDGFKAVNDEYGHAVGDELLRAVAARIRSLVKGNDIAARIGGDEFVFIQTNVAGPDDAERQARQLHARLTEPVPIHGRLHRIAISLGYSITPAPTADLENLLKMADEASYRVKRQGGGVLRDESRPRALADF